MDVRPPWVSASQKPNDLDKSFHAFMHGFNPNDPKLPKSALVLHNKWGIPRKTHEEAVTRSMDFDLGLDTSRRKDKHRALTVSTLMAVLNHFPFTVAVSLIDKILAGFFPTLLNKS